MSSLYIQAEMQMAYAKWKTSINQIDALLDQLETEAKTIPDPEDKKLYYKRYNLILNNFNLQIDMVNIYQQYLSNNTADLSQYQRTKQKLDLAYKFIKSLGGDPYSLNWLKPSDFY